MSVTFYEAESLGEVAAVIARYRGDHPGTANYARALERASVLLSAYSQANAKAFTATYAARAKGISPVAIEMASARKEPSLARALAAAGLFRYNAIANSGKSFLTATVAQALTEIMSALSQAAADAIDDSAEALRQARLRQGAA
jgi:hypothetical protein